MKKINDFLSNGKLDYKAYADYLFAALTALSENEETFWSVYTKNGDAQSYAETATENMIQNCKGMLNELKIQKDAGYPEKNAQFWNSLHYFRQSFQDWKNSLVRSTHNKDFRLNKYSFELPGEDSVDFESFFNADLFGEDTLRSYSGIKQPEPEKIIAEDKDFYYSFEKEKDGTKLFPNDLPEPDDIHQTTNGTCYMLASLRSLARSNPHMLKGAFREITKNTVTVRFYSQLDNPRVPVDITVSRNCINGLDTDCAPWVRLFEKAYAVYRTRKVDLITEGKIDIKDILYYDAPSFLNALLPTEYRTDPTANVVEKEPNFDAGKKTFTELLKSAQGTDIKTVMTLTTRNHVLDMTRVEEDNGKTYIYYIDQVDNNPVENRISVDKLFSPGCQFDTISVIQLNGNTPAKHISFYPKHNAARLRELDGSMNYDAFAKDMTELLVSEVTNRFKAKGLYANIANPVSEFARKDRGIEDFLKNEFYQNFRKSVSRYSNYRDFLNKCDPPEGPESPIKGLIDRMVVQLGSDLKYKKKGELASELEQVFKAPVNKPAEPKEEPLKPQPKQEEPPKPQVQKETIKPQPQEEAPKPQSKDELVERLKATASSIDKLEEKWRSFGDKQTDGDLQSFAYWGADTLKYLKDTFEEINAENITNLEDNASLDEFLKTVTSVAVILKSREGHDPAESGFGDPYDIRLDVASAKAFSEIHKDMLNNPERLITFLTDSDKELEQLLQDKDIKACLNKPPKKNIQEKPVEPQPVQETPLEPQIQEEAAKPQPEDKATDPQPEEKIVETEQSYYGTQSGNDKDKIETEEVVANKEDVKEEEPNSESGHYVFSKEGMKMLTSWLDKVIYSQDSKDIQNTEDFSYIMENRLFAKYFDSVEDSKRIEKANRGDKSTSLQDDQSLIGSIIETDFYNIDEVFSALNSGDVDRFKKCLDNCWNISAYDYHDSLYQIAAINYLNKNELNVGFAVINAIEVIQEAVEDNIPITDEWLSQKSKEVENQVKKEERFYNQMMSDVVDPMSDIAAAIKTFNKTVRTNYEKAGRTCPDKALIKIEEVDQYFADIDNKITDFRVAIFMHAGQHGLQSITKKLLEAREYAIQDGMGDGLNDTQFDYLANYKPEEDFFTEEDAEPEQEEPEKKQDGPEQKPDEPEQKPKEPEQKPDRPEQKPDRPEQKPDEPEQKPKEPEPEQVSVPISQFESPEPVSVPISQFESPEPVSVPIEQVLNMEQKQRTEELAERLKATASSLDKLAEKWRKFGEVDEELKKFTDRAIGYTAKIKNLFTKVNAENVDNLQFMAFTVNEFVRTAVVLKYLEDQSLVDGTVDYTSADHASFAVYVKEAFKDLRTKLQKEPEQLIEFLANPDKELEQVLQDPDVIKCFDGRFPQNVQEKPVELQNQDNSEPVSVPISQFESPEPNSVPIDQFLNNKQNQPEDVDGKNIEQNNQHEESDEIDIEQNNQPEEDVAEQNKQLEEDASLNKHDSTEPEPASVPISQFKSPEPASVPISQFKSPEPVSVPISQFKSPEPVKEDPDDKLLKDIKSELKKSIDELKSAKTLVNSDQYKDLIQTMDKFSKPGQLDKKNLKTSLTELAGKIDDYINHKAADGVKTNTYKKLAAVQKANLWVCKGLKRFQNERPFCYAEALENYRGVDRTGLPTDDKVNYKAIADKLSKKDPGINKAMVENVDDCIRMIILKADSKKRPELNAVRDTFNLVAAPKLNKAVEAPNAEKNADPVKVDRQKSVK